MSNSAKFLIAGSFLLTSTLGAITVNKYFFSRKNRSNEEKDTNNALEISNKNKQIFSPKPIHKERNYNAGTNSEIQSAISSNKRINTSKIYPKSNKVNIELQASQEADINQSKREREDLLIENKESEKLEREEIERKKRAKEEQERVKRKKISIEIKEEKEGEKNQEKDTQNSLKVSNDNEKALSPKPIHEETNESTNTHSQKKSAISLNKNILNSENSTKKEDASNQEKDTQNSLKVSNDNEKALSPKPIHEETNESTNTHSQKKSAISLNKNILNSENSTKKEDASNQEKDTQNSLKVSNIVRDRRIDSTIRVLRFKQLDNEELMLVSAFSSDSSE